MTKDVILQPIDYDHLTKIQKLALLMIVIGADSAAKLLKDFDDTDVELICREIANFKIVDQEIQEKVLSEFSGIVGESCRAIRGGARFAEEALRMARGDFRASNLLGRISPVGSSLEVIREISDMEPRQIYNLLKTEQVQTIAFVISYLNVDKACAVAGMLPMSLREEVLERVGAMDETTLENVARVVQALKQHFSTKNKQTLHRSGGVRAVADMLNIMDKDDSKSLLTSLEQRNPALGSAIRRKMFSFEDLGRLDPVDLQRVSREVDMNDLVVALKSANSNLQEAIFGSVSRRAAESLKEEMEMLGPVRLKDVEAAQDRVIQIVRKLEDEGEISLDNGGSDRVLV